MVMRDEKMPKGTAWREATVGSAAARRSYERVWCEDCRHDVTLAAQDLIDRGVPPETPFWTLAQRLNCGSCGSVRVGIMAASGDRKRDNPERP